MPEFCYEIDADQKSVKKKTLFFFLLIKLKFKI